MKSKCICGYCKEDLGMQHGNNQEWALLYHFESKHPEELTEVKEMYDKLGRLKKKYSLCVSNFLIQ